MCIFCGTKDETFTEEMLDTHYWKSCPMLKRCTKCSQVHVEISIHSLIIYFEPITLSKLYSLQRHGGISTITMNMFYPKERVRNWPGKPMRGTPVITLQLFVYVLYGCLNCRL